MEEHSERTEKEGPMIWPWSKIWALELELLRAQAKLADYQFKVELYSVYFEKAREELRGAHKGIKRLKDKLKKVAR